MVAMRGGARIDIRQWSRRWRRALMPDIHRRALDPDLAAAGAIEMPDPALCWKKTARTTPHAIEQQGTPAPPGGPPVNDRVF